MAFAKEKTVVCSRCGKRYKVVVRPIRIVGAGSGADWQERPLLCGHESIRYDDDHEHIDEITEIVS